MELINDVAAWAWARHHNILSWYIRPLFLLPFCFFAYRRSLLGIAVTLVALATSMAWFPAPANPSPAVVEMLDAERDYLFGPWNAAKVFASPADPGHLHRARPRLLAPVAGLGRWWSSTAPCCSRSAGPTPSAAPPAPPRTWCRRWPGWPWSTRW